MSTITDLNHTLSRIPFPSTKRPKTFANSINFSVDLKLRNDQIQAEQLACEVDITSPHIILTGLTVAVRGSKRGQILRTARMIHSTSVKKPLSYWCILHSLPVGKKFRLTAHWIEFTVRLFDGNVVPEASYLSVLHLLRWLVVHEPEVYRYLKKMCTVDQHTFEYEGLSHIMLMDMDLLQMDGTVHPFVKMIVRNAVLSEYGLTIRLAHKFDKIREPQFRKNYP